MLNNDASRFRFISHALNGDGPFRPSVSSSTLTTPTYLVRYPRESDEKFARRNELAFYSSPLAQVCNRFVGFLTERPPIREIPHALYKAIVDDADGKGNSLDIFWQGFMLNAKARGTMLLLVDMPEAMPQSLGAQIALRVAPYLTAITPESVLEYEIGRDGKFDSVTFSGTFLLEDGTREDCRWTFTRDSWTARSKGDRILGSGQFSIGECPVLIFIEGTNFPTFGQFSSIADLAKRLFNLDSELDEILRAQTFSLLTLQVPEGSTDKQKLEAARAIGETIGTSNLMVHSGGTPAFIAPPEGPAKTYIERIEKLRSQIDDIGLAVASPNFSESGISMQMRFHAINAALSYFAARMEDLERRVWMLCAKWLGMSVTPTISWSRDFNMAEVDSEMQILTEMNQNAMPREVIVAQQKKIVALQFAGAEDEESLFSSIDEQLQERRPESPRSSSAAAADEQAGMATSQ